MNNPNQRFDQLLSAMVSKPPLGEEKLVKEAPASSEALFEGSDDTQTPKGKSGATSSKR